MFSGSGVAIVTPFTNGEVDIEKFKSLIDFQLKNNTQALIVLGTTGEASTIDFKERELIVKTAVQHVAKRIPVIIGTGVNSTLTSIKYTKQAEELGADGVLVVTPYYNKATQKGLIIHYTEIANSTKLPVILYNVPGRTCVNIAPKTVAELAKVDNIVAIKEACGDMSQILEIKRLVPEDFMIYSGNDDNVVPILACGGQGVISVAANVVPKEFQRMCELFMNGNMKEALELQLKYKKLVDLLFIEVNPIPVKAAVSALGFIENELRLPLTSIEDNNMILLVEEMKKLQII
ncbi:4-hydroxy-tetrahydrodipicolinate synthase [Serpentinicella alkaliphila]|uniref:4-hydroxy-tetrahydrodipicolinate synthase n=1 Tax=Serpentinicella alkaliphila TaxID=1734049 RepID=A0A4R2THF7_9FIRM|nr:4-hydroxy-tetrahydrodipicolinate synthase [Serpentinicella alkaliphila]QUH26970.1 4-hydroxy-tetrahydrodipicolinate synthase [Serpentinicella alkaliphila]TCQ00565.1 4-hydroxy-tetrahydrodipicolinate synthase [Serpentinicella alkaliphila]